MGSDRLHEDALDGARDPQYPRQRHPSGGVDGERIKKVFQGRADVTGKSLDTIATEAMANQSLKYMVDPKDIAALAVFLASDAAKSISGQIMPLDGDMQRN
jgi:NAD(P)-dependent dehydrogenase (short-subunit alcohol dehydrogenase family)